MGTVNRPWLCIGSSSCLSPSRIEKFRRKPALQSAFSTCSTSLRSSSERIGFSSKTGAHGHGFLSKVQLSRTLQEKENEPHYTEKQNACQPWAGSCGHCQRISCIPISRRVATSLLLLTSSMPAKLAIAPARGLASSIKVWRCLSPVAASLSSTSPEEDSASGSPEGLGAKIDLNLPRRRLQLSFTCDACGARSQRLINPDAYTRGTVFVQCAGCEVYHKLVDNLGLIEEYDFRQETNIKADGADLNLE